MIQADHTNMLCVDEKTELCTKLEELCNLPAITPESLDEYIKSAEGHHEETKRAEGILQAVVGFSKDAVKDAGLLYWVYHTGNYNRCNLRETTNEALKEHFAPDFRLWEEASRAAWNLQWRISNPPTTLEVFNFMTEHRDLRLFDSHVTDCDSIEEMRKKFELYRKLARGNLHDFYFVPLFDVIDVADYVLVGSQASWESHGGFQLSLVRREEREQVKGLEYPLMFVSGRIHRHTRVFSIHGKRSAKDEQDAFKEAHGVHPANLTLLLYMKLGQLLGHDLVTIPGQASRAYNTQEKDSNLYTIPKYYFRLDPNPETGRYEFNTQTRDRILDKFSRKNEITMAAMQAMDDYFCSLP